MDFTNEFRVSLPIAPAWDLLTDVQRIAPCMPGAQLTGVEDGEYQGTVKVKVGPVTVQYRGVAAFERCDPDERIAVLKAGGRDTRGQGSADALITAQLAPDGDGTRVTVTTRLSVTGKVAQFGKGVMEDISRKLLAQFVAALEGQLAAEQQLVQVPVAVSVPASTPAPANASAPLPTSAPTPVSAPTSIPAPAPADVPALDLLSAARGPVLKRLVPVVVGALLIVGLVIWLTR